MSNFVNAADVPWNPRAVTRVEVETGVTLGVNSLASLPGATVVAATESIDVMKGAVGTPAEPSGAVGADFDKIAIVDGTAYLGVSVYTNSEVKAKGEGEGWGVATNGVITVPAPGKQGFFYLLSKPAK